MTSKSLFILFFFIEFLTGCNNNIKLAQYHHGKDHGRTTELWLQIRFGLRDFNRHLFFYHEDKVTKHSHVKWDIYVKSMVVSILALYLVLFTQVNLDSLEIPWPRRAPAPPPAIIKCAFTRPSR